MLMYVVITLLLGLCVLEYKGVISYKLLILLMFLLMAFVVTNVDMAAYKHMYISVQSITTTDVTDVGFGLLMYIAKFIGLSYYNFVRFITILGLSLITYVFYRHSTCPAFVLAMYFVFAFSAETIQLRAFLAEGILYLTILNIVENGRINIIHYGITMLCALLIHSSSIFFVLLLAIEFIQDRRKLLAIMSALCLLLPVSGTILNMIPIPILRNKVGIYLVAQRDGLSAGALVYILIYLLITGALAYFASRENDEKWNLQLDTLLKIHYICLISCVMIIMFTSNFYRITRTVLVVDFIVVGNYFLEKGYYNRRNAVLISFGVMMVFIVYEAMTGSWHSIMTNNTLFSQFI